MPTATQACHLYGIVPAATAAAGVEGLPGDVEFVPYEQVAALIRLAPGDPARQLRPYLLGYAEILDRVAGAGPVLPVRFGTTLPAGSSVAEEVLMPGHDSFVAALAALAGKSQFTVRARYQEDAVIREVLAEQPQTARLHRQLDHSSSARGNGADQAARVRLGELVARAINGKRAVDSEVLTERVREHAVAVVVEPTRSVDGDRIADVACLVEPERRAGFEATVAELAESWRHRARLRLLGPMAPYHFADGLAARPSGEG